MLYFLALLLYRMIISDPGAPIRSNLNRRDEIMRHDSYSSLDKKKIGNPQHSVITSVKLKLASATELRKSADVRKWILILAKSLANYGRLTETKCY